jgi:hypothetical protein
VEKRGTYQDNELLHGKKQEMNCIFFGQRIGESLSWIIKKENKEPVKNLEGNKLK